MNKTPPTIHKPLSHPDGGAVQQGKSAGYLREVSRALQERPTELVRKRVVASDTGIAFIRKRPLPSDAARSGVVLQSLEE